MAVEQHQMPADATERMAQAVKEDNVSELNKEDNQGRPDWLQPKFSTPEDLAKAYDELERKLGGQTKPKPPEAATERLNPAEQGRAPEAQEEQNAPSPSEQENAPQAVIPGLETSEVEELSQYAWENQGLDDEHYQRLEKAGYSREVVDAYMAGQFAVQEQYTGRLVEAGGGEQNVDAMFKWAEAGGLEQSQIDAYNEYFDQGGPQALMAMENLRAKYENSGNATYRAVTGANAPSYETSRFESSAQVMNAMSDPRYKVDPAFRAEVARKLQRSPGVLGNGRA